MITKMQPQTNVAVPQSVTTQPQQIVGVSANAVILKMSDIQQISTVGSYACFSIYNFSFRYQHDMFSSYVRTPIFLKFRTMYFHYFI